MPKRVKDRNTGASAELLGSSRAKSGRRRVSEETQMSNTDPRIRAELLDQLSHLEVRERGLRERERLRRHLASLSW